MIDIALDKGFAKKQNCCGCTACVAVCPKGCITMCEDHEGFLYPVVDKKNCIDCTACEKVCPILNTSQELPFKQRGISCRIGLKRFYVKAPLAARLLRLQNI